ncbi:MAG: hypothetical protein EA400_00580 [Chromatiaceae bacterium]|nr:MAG: hypothetical protein EA400_00580 [Chromatiaceae bacterium]
MPAEPVTGLSPDGTLGVWLAAIDRHGLRRPDATSVPVQSGAAVADAQYKGARTLVFLQPLAQEISAMLADKGWRVLDFSDRASWDH